MLSDAHRVNYATLTNLTMTPLVFKVMTSKPFCMVRVDKRTRRPNVTMQETSFTELRPHENIMVQ